jgi:hypothetical protein
MLGATITVRHPSLFCKGKKEKGEKRKERQKI